MSSLEERDLNLIDDNECISSFIILCSVKALYSICSADMRRGQTAFFLCRRARSEDVSTAGAEALGAACTCCALTSGGRYSGRLACGVGARRTARLCRVRVLGLVCLGVGFLRGVGHRVLLFRCGETSRPGPQGSCARHHAAAAGQALLERHWRHVRAVIDPSWRLRRIAIDIAWRA